MDGRGLVGLVVTILMAAGIGIASSLLLGGKSVPQSEARATPVARRTVGFDVLAGFDVRPLLRSARSAKPSEVVAVIESGLPAVVRALKDQQVLVGGYMIPIDFDDQGVRTFLLCRWQPGCCFDHVPQAHDQIYVTMPAGKRAQFVITPVRVHGRLRFAKTGQLTFETSLYRLAPTRIEVGELLPHRE